MVTNSQPQGRRSWSCAVGRVATWSLLLSLWGSHIFQIKDTAGIPAPHQTSSQLWYVVRVCGVLVMRVLAAIDTADASVGRYCCVMSLTPLDCLPTADAAKDSSMLLSFF